jgi:hypothetical protein
MGPRYLSNRCGTISPSINGCFDLMSHCLSTPPHGALRFCPQAPAAAAGAPLPRGAPPQGRPAVGKEPSPGAG